MAEPREFRFRKGDLLAIGAVIAVAILVALCYLPPSNPGTPYAEIYLNGQKIRTVALDEEQTFTVTDRYTNEITVEGGKIAVTRSDCPGSDCVHSGFSGSAGRSIVCLPNGLEIRIIATDGDVDFVVG